jgi:GT2 family glycosyltransferase
VPVDVSVIIPTFRRNGELLEAIASVQAQTMVNFEIIVVDDCPDGGARPVVAALHDSRISYFRNPHPTGGVPSIVRNLGWPHATGRFVHFLDDDDIVPAGHYTSAVAAFSQRPDVGLVFGRIEPFGCGPKTQLQHERHFFANAARTAAICARLGEKLAFAGQMLFDMPLLVCSGGMVRRECVIDVGGFDPEIRLMEDADFHLRVMRTCGAHVLDSVTVCYRIGFPSLMHAPAPSPSQLRMQHEGRRRMQAKYHRAHGSAEFFALAAFTRAMRMARRSSRRSARDFSHKI